ncbi:MAG: hypothetical protein WA160_14010 [Pseudobdellovibrio sp.]
MNLIRSAMKNAITSIYTKRRKICAVALIVLLIPMFQNCGGGHSTRALSSTLSGTDAANSNDNGGATNPPVVMPTPAPTPGSVYPLSDVQKFCKEAVSLPSITSMSVADVTIKSGLGTVDSGDAAAAAVHVVANRGISDLAKYNKYTCDTQFSINLNCSVVSDNTNYPISITNAISTPGNDMLKQTPIKTPMDLAKDSIKTGNCNAIFSPGSNSLDFIITPNSGTNGERCVQGSYWLKINVTSQVNGTAGSNVSAETKYLKVNVNNGCWAESRLKDAAGNLSAVVNFGTVVAMGTGWTAVLAPTDNSASAAGVGSVYMYMYDGSNWVQKQKIMIADAIARESLNSIAINGDSMVIGSPYRNKMGAVFFYRRSGETWNLVQKIDAQDVSQQYQDFGSSVAISDSYIFVGAPSYMFGGMAKAGSVSVYSYTAAGATFVKTLTGVATNSAFGTALAVSGSTLAVGAPQAIGKELLAEGSVYLFSEAAGSWNLISAATKKGTSLAEKFGAAVALLGTKLIVGSPNYTADVNKPSAGRATFYSDYNVATATKTWDGNEGSGNLGQGIALSSTGIYIGIPYSASRAGGVDHYLYSALTKPYFKNAAYNATANSAFGWSVSASGNNVAIGARIKNDPNDNSGAAYIYRYK